MGRCSNFHQRNKESFKDLIHQRDLHPHPISFILSPFAGIEPTTNLILPTLHYLPPASPKPTLPTYLTLTSFVVTLFSVTQQLEHTDRCVQFWLLGDYKPRQTTIFISLSAIHSISKHSKHAHHRHANQRLASSKAPRRAEPTNLRLSNLDRFQQ